MANEHARRLLILIGDDKTGLLEDVFALLAEAPCVLCDLRHVRVDQSVTLHLVLSFARTSDQGSPDQVLEALMHTCRERHGLVGHARALQGAALPCTALDASSMPRLAVTVIGDALAPRVLGELAGTLHGHGAQIDAIRRLSDGALFSAEFLVRMVDATKDLESLRASLLASDWVARMGKGASADRPLVDVAVQREGLLRRNKRLVVFDMDSTLISVEVIDELARMHGVLEEVSRITSEAMHGALPFEESLTRRVAMLKGLSFARVEALVQRLPLTEGAEELLRILRRLGYKTAVISGGFSCATSSLQQRLGLDHAFANTLEVKDGVLTGAVLPPVVGPARKAALLREIATGEGIPLAQTVAVGDGANDLAMLQAAGLGIAFHAKPALRSAADACINTGGLDRILYFLGFSRAELQHLVD